MKFNDEQLAEILKQVQVPAALKDQLRKIPDQAVDLQAADLQVASVLPKTSLGSRRVLGWLSVATAAAVFLSLIWTKQWEASKDSQNGTATANHDTSDVPQIHSLASDMEPMNRQINADSLTMVELQSEIYDIEKELEAIQPISSSANQHLNDEEYTSLVIATSAQTAILSGASIEYLRGDLEQSVQRFPDTRGSAIAAQLLASAAVQP